MRAAIGALVVVVALVGAACGGGGVDTQGAGAGDDPGTPAPAASGPGSAAGAATRARTLDANPCSLVTAQEAAATLGGSPGSSTVGSPDQQHSCHWSAPGGSILVIGNDLVCDALILALDQNLLTPDQERISDVGQGGIINTKGGAVSIKAKGGCFSIDATKDRLPVPKATMLQLARTATSRI
jgi:hypothetical protein